MRATVLVVIGIGGLGGSGLVGAEEQTEPVAIHLAGERSATFGDYQKAGVRFRNPHYQPPDQRRRPPSVQPTTSSPTLSLQAGAINLVLHRGERDPLSISAKHFRGSFTRQYPDRTQEFYEPKPVVDEHSILTGCAIGTGGTVEETSAIVLALAEWIEGENRDLKAWLDHRLWEKPSLQTYVVTKDTEDLHVALTIHGVVEEDGKDLLAINVDISWPRLRPVEATHSGPGNARPNVRRIPPPPYR